MALGTAIKKSIQWTSYTSGASTFWAKRHSRMRIIQFHGIGGDDYPVIQRRDSGNRIQRRHPALRDGAEAVDDGGLTGAMVRHGGVND